MKRVSEARERSAFGSTKMDIFARLLEQRVWSVECGLWRGQSVEGTRRVGGINAACREVGGVRQHTRHAAKVALGQPQSFTQRAT